MKNQRKAIRALQALFPGLPKTKVVDIGANPTEKPPYLALLQTNQAQVYAFEPDPRAFAALKEAPQENIEYINAAVGDGKEHTLYICQASYMTSLLRPADENTGMFPQMARNLRVTDEVSLQTKALDQIPELQGLDLLKIDVQGSELSVFQNGREKLAKALCVQTEVSFFPIYENQPGFGELDVELRKQGFLPHSMPVVHKNPIYPLKAARRFGQQLLDGDIIYLRDLRHMEAFSLEQLLQLAVIGVGFVNAPDVTARALVALSKRGEISQDDINDFVSRFPPENGAYDF